MPYHVILTIHNTQTYFGSAKYPFHLDVYQNYQQDSIFVDSSLFSRVKEQLTIQKLICLKQTHSAQGIVVNGENINTIRLFEIEGDFLITNIPGIGIGVMAADCLPITLYDPTNHAIGIVHAGWKGSAQQIVRKTIDMMCREYATHSPDLIVHFGPSANSCCYEVKEEFIANISHIPSWQETIEYRAGKIYFNNALYNQRQLVQCGVPISAINTQHNQCTIHNHEYASHRRDPEARIRQLTAITLR